MWLGRALKQLAACVLPWAFVVSGRLGRTHAVAITFDDGPHPENTRRILDVLAKHQAKATFFLQGSMAELYPDLVREIVKCGHQIGNHGYAHWDAKMVPTDQYVSDVMRAQKVLENIVGHELPREFRPPFGNIAVGTSIALLRQKFRFVFWSHDSRDSYLREGPALLEYITRQPIAAGSIILFHEDYSHTVEVIPKILDHLKQQGLQFVSVEELMAKRTT